MYLTAKEYHVLSLNGLKLSTLATFLGECPEVKVVLLGFDNDEAGRGAMRAFEGELKAKSYFVASCPPGSEFKDWNEQLQAERRAWH